MGTATHRIADGRISDQLGHLDPMFEADDFGIHLGLFIELLDPVAEIVQVSSGPLQPFAGSDDTGVIPHRGPDKHPVLIDKGWVYLFFVLRVVPLMDVGKRV